MTQSQLPKFRYNNKWLEAIDRQASDERYCKLDHFNFCLYALEYLGQTPSLNWRIARAALLARNRSSSEVTKQTLSQLCRQFARKASKLNPNCPYIQKYNAFSLWLLANDTTDASVEVGLVKTCKEYLDKAIENLPFDVELLQLRGEWYYKVATVRSVDKIISFVAGLKLPKASLDMAKDDLLRANELQPGNKSTCLQLVRIYSTIGDNSAALNWTFRANEAKCHGIQGYQVCAEIKRLQDSLLKENK